jgi:hypothetical protein
MGSWLQEDGEFQATLGKVSKRQHLRKEIQRQKAGGMAQEEECVVWHVRGCEFNPGTAKKDKRDLRRQELGGDRIPQARYTYGIEPPDYSHSSWAPFSKPLRTEPCIAFHCTPLHPHNTLAKCMCDCIY